MVLTDLIIYVLHIYQQELKKILYKYEKFCNSEKLTNKNEKLTDFANELVKRVSRIIIYLCHL